MIHKDIQETKDFQKTKEILRDFKNDLDDAAKELDKIERSEKKWQLIFAFYSGVAFTVIAEVIALLVSKGLHS